MRLSHSYSTTKHAICQIQIESYKTKRKDQTQPQNVEIISNIPDIVLKLVTNRPLHPNRKQLAELTNLRFLPHFNHITNKIRERISK